jgi:hypothetical protein
MAPARTDWQFYPNTSSLPNHLRFVIDVFDAATAVIGSNTAKLTSNKVLAEVAQPLADLGYKVETGAKRAQKVHVPVMFGRRGAIKKAFEVDAYSAKYRTVIEIEAGRAVANNQFLKDLFEASVMPDVDYAVVAVRLNYRGQRDFDKMCTYLDSLYASHRFRLPFQGVLAIGY